MTFDPTQQNTDLNFGRAYTKKASIMRKLLELNLIVLIRIRNGSTCIPRPQIALRPPSSTRRHEANR